MDYIIKKSNHCVTLESGNTTYLMISFKPSLNHMDRIQDIGIMVQVNKKEYHSSILPKITQLLSEVNSELLVLNSLFKGRLVEEFNTRSSLPNEAQ